MAHLSDWAFQLKVWKRLSKRLKKLMYLNEVTGSFYIFVRLTILTVLLRVLFISEDYIVSWWFNYKQCLLNWCNRFYFYLLVFLNISNSHNHLICLNRKRERKKAGSVGYKDLLIVFTWDLLNTHPIDFKETVVWLNVLKYLVRNYMY